MKIVRCDELHPAPWRHVWAGLMVLIGACFVCPTPARAQPERFNAVKSWRGSYIAWARQNTVEQLPGGRGSVKVFYNCYFTADFLLDEFEDDPAIWRGRLINPHMESSYRGVARKVIDLKEGNTMDEVESFDTSGAPQTGGSPVELKFHRERGWSFHFGTPGRPTQLSEEITLTTKKGVMLHEKKQREILASAESGTATFPYPAKGMILFAGDQKSEGARHIPGSIAGDIAWEYTVYLEPASMEELRLEIDPSKRYEDWRPTTTPSRGRGEPLDVTVNLVAVTGGKPNSRVERFIWELVDTSREPGVALNFPLDQLADSPDLEFDATGVFFVLSKENQRMERAVREGFTDKVSVVPFDWGGWSTLQVTAVLADGRRVMGKLKGKSERGLRIPKRDPNSHIADGWKAKRKSGPDDLDDEADPEGDGSKGDGFTLYEEYRGFVIKGAPVEGDPKAKDFFVLNQIGDDAETGIGLFASLSGFHVHTTRLDTEISVAHRIMNANRIEGAQVVQQHAVRLQTFATVKELGGSGAFTVGLDGSRGGKNSFRPATTLGIGILPRSHADSDFNKPFNLPAADIANAYDRAIAHELLHSVGAIHHGPDDPTAEFFFVGPKSPFNKIGRPYFAKNSVGSAPVELRNEAGHDVAATVYSRYAAAFAGFMSTFRAPMMGNPGDPGYPRMTESDFEAVADGNVRSAFELKGVLGQEGGAHSGHQDCIMRYYFAGFYPAKKPAEGFYQIAAGTEQVGSILCRSPAGTGVNASGHVPQSRHGNAADGGGNCAKQISPNDLTPSRPTSF